MATLILTDDDQGQEIQLNAGATFNVIGTNGVDNVVVAAGANASLNLLGGNDTISVQGNKSDYTVKATGTEVTLTFNDGSMVTIPASTTSNSVSFGSGETFDLVIDTDQGAVVLGDQVLTEQESAVNADSSVTSLDGQGIESQAVTIDAGTGSFAFTDDYTVSNYVIINNFGADDSITLTGVTDDIYNSAYASTATDVSLTMNDNGIESSVQLIGVGGGALTIDLFNALDIGDILMG